MTRQALIWSREGLDPERLERARDLPDDQVIIVERSITGGDFSNAGTGATEIKRVIKKLAISPAIARRAGIACFEAEVNVVVYAEEGVIAARISPASIAVTVTDRGPGIPDIEQAMVPGWTTATAEVREMGFGAGLGLPNIQQNSDHLEITSETGVGTKIFFVILLDGC
jgi:anti-sigma regulatory factor (Ser/Thr protein kinase)